MQKNFHLTKKGKYNNRNPFWYKKDIIYTNNTALLTFKKKKDLLHNFRFGSKLRLFLCQKSTYNANFFPYFYL